ncbi:MAG: LysM peptidoglycan-binding domain-containing protein, partial [Muribaculaceae bacterium]|nr:LysM peptidoglycan-binding domain-containing protein [Muribaculaceae bacterium]
IIAESGRLAPRSVVEVGGPAGTSGETIKWHKVKRGETLASIARKYGVTQREIRSWNGLKSSKIARGKLLKIIVCEAPKPKEDVSQQGQVDVIYEDPAQQQSEATAVVSESAAAAAAVVEGEEPTVPDVLAAEAEPEFESASDGPEAPAAPESHIHKVAKGDTLYSLSKRYGVSVDAIRQANGLKDSSLRIGQRLKIPSK